MLTNLIPYCFHLESQVPAGEVSTNGSNYCLSPDKRQHATSNPVPRPLSPDSPEIISELQCYTGGPPAGVTSVSGGQPENDIHSLHSSKPLQTNGSSKCSSLTGTLDHHVASDTNQTQDARTGPKRKASSPSVDEKPSKLPSAGKHSSAPVAAQGFPFSGGYSLPSLGLNPPMLSGSVGHPLFPGAGSPYFQPPHTQLGTPGYRCEDLFSMDGSSNPPSPTSSSTSSTVTTTPAVPSSAAVKAASLLSSALPPFMLNRSFAGMAGMLPPGFPLSYSQSLASLYAGTMLPGGLPGSAATPGPGGASFLPQYPPAAASTSSSSSPSSFSSSAQSDGHCGPLVVNGGNVRSSSSSDDDVVEVMGK